MAALHAAPTVLVAGHICLDLTPALGGPPALEPGRLIEVGPAAAGAGGAVGNTGVALHRLGIPVRLIAKVGDDVFGRSLRDTLEREGTGLADGLITAPAQATSYSIVISPPGVDRSFLHCPGANDAFLAADVHPAELRRARLLHFGYPPLMPAMYADDGAQLQALFATAQAAGLATSLDVSRPDPHGPAGRADWTAILEHVLPCVDVFLPSADELRFMLRTPEGALDRALLSDLGGRLIELGVAVAAIKLGDQGLYVRTAAGARIAAFCERLELDAAAWAGRELLSPCFLPRHVAGTTGCGDCTIAGFLAALVRGDGPAAAATAATAVGACSVEAAHGTDGVAPWPRIAGRLAQGWRRAPLTLDLGPAQERDEDASGTLTFTAP